MQKEGLVNYFQTGPNLEKKYMWLLDTVLSHEILRKIYL